MPQGRVQNFTHEINLGWNKCQIERWQNRQDLHSYGALKIICCVIIRSNSCLCKLLLITLPVILGHQEKVIWSLETIKTWGNLCHFIHLFHLTDIAFANYMSKDIISVLKELEMER